MHTTTEAGDQPADAGWDLIRVPRHIGLATLRVLTDPDLPIIVDPAQRVVLFLVPCGAADTWTLPGAQILQAAQVQPFVLPSMQRVMPPGRYWLTRPSRQVRPVRLRLLHAALEAACRTPLMGNASRRRHPPFLPVRGRPATHALSVDVGCAVDRNGVRP
jgi:hypothetical protein